MDVDSRTDMRDMEKKSRFFSDHLSTRVKALEGKLETLRIYLPLPIRPILRTIQELKKDGHVALKNLDLIQYDEGAIELVNFVLPTLYNLKIRSKTYRTTTISLPDFIQRFDWCQSSNLTHLFMYCRLPDPNEIPNVQIQIPSIPQELLPLEFLGEAEFRLIFIREEHPLGDQGLRTAYLDLVCQMAQAISPLLDPKRFKRHHPIISSYSSRLSGPFTLEKDYEYSNTFHATFHGSWDGLDDHPKMVPII